jgi:hypothetical protein
MGILAYQAAPLFLKRHWPGVTTHPDTFYGQTPKKPIKSTPASGLAKNHQTVRSLKLTPNTVYSRARKFMGVSRCLPLALSVYPTLCQASLALAAEN